MKFDKRKIISAMVANGIDTQRQLSKRSGVSEMTIGRAFKGNSVNLSTLRKLSNALGVEPTDIMED